MRIPVLRLHKPTGQARARWQGKDYYFGKWGLPSTERRYREWVQELLAGNPAPPSRKHTSDTQVLELCLRFLKMAEGRYSKGEFYNLKQAIRVLVDLHGDTKCNQFGPKALMAVRQAMVDAGWPRGRVNTQVQKVRRIFRWGVSQELLHVHVALALREILPLREGETAAPESVPVKPAEQSQVEAILPQLVPTHADMLRVLNLTGMRPGELFTMRPGDIDTSDEVWVYRPGSHKNKWRGQGLAYALGPRAQAILKPRMKRPAGEYLFKPADAIRERQELRAATRKTKRTPSQIRKMQTAKTRKVADCYNRTSFRNALFRGVQRLAKGDCERFDALYFRPNQLRHSKATDLRSTHGLEAARIALGHADVATTLIYAERDLAKAKQIALATG